jgi:HAD superfamily hydrolase (TIGR01509 family)
MTADFSLVRFNALLFDFDGTLIDSSGLHASAFRNALTVERPDLLSGFSYEALKGMTTLEAFQALGVAEKSSLSRCASRKQDIYRTSLAEGALLPLPGSVEVLENASRCGYRCFLVTSGSAASVMLALLVTGLGRFFEGVVTADDVKCGKPAPDPYSVCLKNYGINPDETAAVEDAHAGVASARGAGLSVVGVNNFVIAAEVDIFFPDLMAFGKALSAIANSRRIQ